MNILFVTQSKSLDVFYQIYKRLKGRLDIKKAGFYVANCRHFFDFTSKNPGFPDESSLLKEWEIYQEAQSCTPDLAWIAQIEKEIGDPTLWTPIITDRRLYLGSRATFHQDYKPAFSHERQLAVLDVALRKFKKLFDDVKPDAVCTIYTATFGDCIAHLIAKSRGIKSLDLRLARLKNYVMFVDGITEPPPHIAAIHGSMDGGVPRELAEKAEEYIKSVIDKNAMYEGVVPAKEKAGRKTGGVSVFSVFPKAVKIMSRYLESGRAPFKYDYQNPDPIKSLLYRKIFNPLTVRRIKGEFAGRFVRAGDVAALDYILYPLHTEPELVLAQFARPFLNQVEVIRNISLSMPVGMKLLVKEHPMMVGRRPVSYYRKILDIPNVRLVDLDLPSESVLKNAKMCVVIRGAIGLEAVIKRIPVVSLGKTMFDLLPDCMFRKCRNLYSLPDDISGMLRNYKYDHTEMVRYLASVIKGSVPVNLISDLMGKPGRFREAGDTDKVPYEEHPHFDVLAEYLHDRLTDGIKLAEN